MLMKSKALAIFGTLLAASAAIGQTANKATADKTTNEYTDLLRKEHPRRKSSVVDMAMGLDSTQKSKFYPDD